MALANSKAALLGADAESVGNALERAAAFLWSHERLVELADGARQDTLDQIAPERVLALEAPQRATTTLDYERIARDVPGTRIARARAFATFDPRIPCYSAPGTVTVVVVPYLPAERPSPSAGLLAAVRRHLERRRILTTRLVVVGPSYVDVKVTAQVRALETADPLRVQQDIVHALTEFLHPLRGGPNGLGWPFGRDVYRSEILATIDAVAGVDHVLSASLTAERNGISDDSQCGNVCVPPTYLVASLPHSIDVVLP
jgi:predicted phage baseplate assembly protein